MQEGFNFRKCTVAEMFQVGHVIESVIYYTSMIKPLNYWSLFSCLKSFCIIHAVYHVVFFVRMYFYSFIIKTIEILSPPLF